MKSKFWESGLLVTLVLCLFVLLIVMHCSKDKNPAEASDPVHETGTMTDIDGNVYQTVKIGNQWWMAENLKATHYRNGDDIPNEPGTDEWANLTVGARCAYDNNENNVPIYGYLYNWYAVNTGKLAPAGWHVPTNAEWDTLQNYLIANGYNWDGTTDSNKIAKSMSAQADWDSYGTIGAPGNDIQSNNRSGFSAMPAGFRDHYNDFCGIGIKGFWWSSTVALYGYHYHIYYDYVDLLSKTRTSEIVLENCPKGYGFSVRLLRD